MSLYYKFSFVNCLRFCHFLKVFIQHFSVFPEVLLFVIKLQRVYPAVMSTNVKTCPLIEIEVS